MEGFIFLFLFCFPRPSYSINVPTFKFASNLSVGFWFSTDRSKGPLRDRWRTRSHPPGGCPSGGVSDPVHQGGRGPHRAGGPPRRPQERPRPQDLHRQPLPAPRPRWGKKGRGRWMSRSDLKAVWVFFIAKILKLFEFLAVGGGGGGHPCECHMPTPGHKGHCPTLHYTGQGRNKKVTPDEPQ